MIFISLIPLVGSPEVNPQLSSSSTTDYISSSGIWTQVCRTTFHNWMWDGCANHSATKDNSDKNFVDWGAKLGHYFKLQVKLLGPFYPKMQASLIVMIKYYKHANYVFMVYCAFSIIHLNYCQNCTYIIICYVKWLVKRLF